MENDYLWNKTGEDAEIEQLEKTLQVFRYQDNTPPSLPKKVSVEQPIFSLFSWRFVLSFSVCLALFFGGIAAWLNLSRAEKPMLATQIQIIQIPKISLPKIEQSSSKPIVLPIKSSAIQKPKFIQTTFRAKEFSPQIKRKVKPNIQLTKEEKYAYQQLMLALSITGSKLKEVQTKVNGGNEITSEIKSFR